MVWNYSSPCLDNGSGENINPIEILYYYETPLLFTAKVGFINVLCYKLEELPNTDLFLLSPTNMDTIKALRAGKISVRGALSSENYWIVEAEKYRAIKTWSATANDLPEDFLPEPRTGLFEHFGEVPDVIDEVDPFLSFKFSGPELSSGKISFKTFKALVDQVYVSMYSLFTPVEFSGRRASDFFDFEIGQPKFASLLITIKKPVIDFQLVQKGGSENLTINPAEIMEGISGNRDKFLDVTGKIARDASSGQEIKEIIGSNFMLIDAISDLVPGEGMGYNKVEFVARTDGGSQRVVIDEHAGNRIRAAHSFWSAADREIQGKIVEVNSEAGTFVIKLLSERQVTCDFPTEIYARYEANGLIKVGNQVSLKGEYKKRKRRDFIKVKENPTFTVTR